MSSITIPSTFDDAVAGLRSRIAGTVHLPEDPGYAESCAAFNVCVRQEPAVVVTPADATDVAEAVRFARSLGLRVAIQSTGHGIARPADGALLIVTSRMDHVSIDPAARRARMGAGVRWGAVLQAAQAHGLAPLLGSSSGVGAIGYTLGGGFGWLGRRHGLASDSVVAVELVTPDGIEVRASADEQPELFWALKGGGGGTFGVVTAMEIELYPVTEVYAGNLMYPISMAREVMRRWRDWVATVPEELTSAVTLMHVPPFEDIPEPIRGQSFVIVRGCYSGDVEEGRRLVDSWREWRRPQVDMFQVMPFAMADLISMDPQDPVPAMVTSEWFDELADAAIDVIVKATVPAPGQPPVLLMSEIRHAGGAVRAKAGNAANARGRSGEFLLELLGMVVSPHAGLALEAQLRAARRDLAPYVNGAAYLNFCEGREKQERTPQAFDGEHLERVRAVKRALDAEDRFCHGFGVTPLA